MTSLYPVLAAIAAYLVGSLAFAVLVSRAMGLQDPRTFGSKNPGATNVLRSGSKPAAIVTLLLDAMKGFVPVLLVKLFVSLLLIRAARRPRLLPHPAPHDDEPFDPGPVLRAHADTLLRGLAADPSKAAP